MQDANKEHAKGSARCYHHSKNYGFKFWCEFVGKHQFTNKHYLTITNKLVDL
jgi:hypothetical protein